MEWQVVLLSATPAELLTYRLVSRGFRDIIGRESMWRAYLTAMVKGCERQQDFRVCTNVEDVMMMLNINLPEEMAQLRVQHARALHRKHWGKVYCPLSWGREAHDLALTALRDGQEATRWMGLWISAWNGARYLMKVVPLTREAFEPLFEYARTLRKAPQPYAALGMFTEGYIYFAMGFSNAGKPQDFVTAFDLQQRGLSQYPNRDEIQVEMCERIARTSVFTDPSRSSELYRKAFDAATELWRDPAHPLAKSIVLMMQFLAATVVP